MARTWGAKISGTSPPETAAVSAGRYWSGVPKIRLSILMFGFLASKSLMTAGNVSFISVYQLQILTVAVPPELEPEPPPEEHAARTPLAAAPAAAVAPNLSSFRRSNSELTNEDPR